VVILLISIPLSARVTAEQAQPSLKVRYEAHLDQSFKFYGYLTEQMSVEVSGMVDPHGEPTFVTVGFPFDYSDLVGLPRGANYSLQSYQVLGSSFTVLTVEIPSNESSFEFTLVGTLAGLSSLFFRNVAYVPPISVTMNVPPFTSGVEVLVPDSSVQIRYIYPSKSSQFISIGGNSYLQLNPSAVEANTNSTGVKLVYQSPLSDYYAFLAIVGLASLAFASPAVVRRSRPLLGRAWQRLPPIAKTLSGAVARRRGTRWLFTSFVVLCLAMIAVSTVFGPPPQPRAYLAATPATSKGIGPYITQAGWSYLTTSQAADGFGRTSNLGTFSVAIIADYPPPILTSSPSQSGLQYVPYVIVLRSYVTSSYLNQVLSTRGYTTTVLNNPSDLVSTLTQLGGRQNALGLTISQGLYIHAAQSVGVLSLLVPFLALAFMASLYVELGASGFHGLFEAAAYALLVYLVAEFAFIVSSVMLGTPVALHAAISNTETAEGLLGPFGGGTRPREVSGILGFLSGIYYNRKGSLSYDRNLLAAIGAGMAFVIVDPLNVASGVYELLLTVSSNVGIGIGGPSSEFSRGIIGQPLGLFQSYITSGYVASHGVALFFVSALPFLLYSKVGKGTGTILMLFAALGCGLGFVRVADMVPMEVIASAAPGLLLGSLLIPAFWAIDRLEAVVRARSPFR